MEHPDGHARVYANKGGGDNCSWRGGGGHRAAAARRVDNCAGRVTSPVRKASATTPDHRPPLAPRDREFPPLTIC